MAQFFSPENENANYGLAMGLLANSGWSPTPQSRGPALASGLQGYLQGRQFDRQRAEQNQWAQLAKQMGLEGIPASAVPGLVSRVLEGQLTQESFAPLSDEEERAMGLPPAGVYQRNRAGQVSKVYEPPNQGVKIVDKRLPGGLIQQVLVDDAGRELRPFGAPYKPDSRSDASGMRKEFTTLSKPFIDVRDSYRRIQASAQSPSPAGDLALIFNYMKMLDPGSVVRESEFATAATAKPLLERLGISFDAVGAVWEGKKLTPDQRVDFVRRADALYRGATAQHGQLASEYSRLASGAGFDPGDVVIDLQSVNAGIEAGAGAPRVGEVVDGYRFKGGDPADEKNWELIK